MKKAIITGANRGIGLEFTRKLLSEGYSVTALCRKASDELSSLSNDQLTVFEDFDVTSDASIAKLKETLSEDSIDLLINNAGIARRESIEEFNLSTMKEQFEVNSLAPLKVTVELVPYLKKGARVGMVTSRMGSIADNDSGGSYGYRMSKAALNAGAKSLSIDLKDKGISIAILHPGWVKTDMTGNSGLIDTEESVRGLTEILENKLTPETSGSFWHTNGELLPW
jgi:NAD(P)-dependent dehydrogenase (short-subunit alcohol dehydrogenase family)